MVTLPAYKDKHVLPQENGVEAHKNFVPSHLSEVSFPSPRCFFWINTAVLPVKPHIVFCAHFLRFRLFFSGKRASYHVRLKISSTPKHSSEELKRIDEMHHSFVMKKFLSVSLIILDPHQSNDY